MVIRAVPGSVGSFVDEKFAFTNSQFQIPLVAKYYVANI